MTFHDKWNSIDHVKQTSTRVVLLVITVPLIWAKLTVVPRNHIVYVGQHITFHCATNNLSRPINWFCLGRCSMNESGTSAAYLYMSNRTSVNYRNRITIKPVVKNHTRHYDLLILHVAESDNGSYTCVDLAGSGQRATAQLIILQKPSTVVEEQFTEELNTSLSHMRDVHLNKLTITDSGSTVVIVIVSVIVVCVVLLTLFLKAFYRFYPQPNLQNENHSLADKGKPQNITESGTSDENGSNSPLISTQDCGV